MVRFRKTSKSKLLKRGGKSVKKRGKTLKKKGKSVKKRGGKYNKNKRGKRRNTLKRGGLFGMFGASPPKSFNNVAYNTYHGKNFSFNGTYYKHYDYPKANYTRMVNYRGDSEESTTYDYILVED